MSSDHDKLRSEEENREIMEFLELKKNENSALLKILNFVNDKTIVQDNVEKKEDLEIGTNSSDK